MRRSINRSLLAAVLACVTGATPLHAAALDLEYEIKAAFLYNFAKFVEWPPTAFDAADAPIVFCVVGHNPFNGSLARVVSDRTANGRRIEVRHLAADDNLSGCNLIFMAESEDEQVAQVLQKTRNENGRPVLTVGESKEFAEAGGMIRLLVDQGRIRFDINVVEAERAGLRLSSQLLKLARTVIR